MYVVPKELYITNRNKVIKHFPKENAVIMLKGDITSTRYDCVFEQNSNFRYLFGVNLPDCYGIIHLKTNKTILFIPKKFKDLVYKYVNGNHVDKMSNIKNDFGIDVIAFTDQLYEFFTTESIKKFYVLNVSVLDFNKLPKLVTVNDTLLKDVLTASRVIKSSYELVLMKHINDISSAAHSELQKLIHPGLNEYQLESLFNHHIYFYGHCRHPAYAGICASGTDASVLHYISNHKRMENGTIALIDMGAQYAGYISDITQTIPVNRKFDSKQREIYGMVLKVHNIILKTIKPGMKWSDIGKFCDFMIVSELLDHGFLKGSIQELINNELYYYFMPHKLAHFIGLEVHDVGNLYGKYELLQPGMTLAMEPGIYFNKDLMHVLIKNENMKKYVNFNKVKQYQYIGGMRVESNIIITNNGIDVMTSVNRSFGL